MVVISTEKKEENRSFFLGQKLNRNNERDEWMDIDAVWLRNKHTDWIPKRDKTFSLTLRRLFLPRRNVGDRQKRPRKYFCRCSISLSFIFRLRAIALDTSENCTLLCQNYFVWIFICLVFHLSDPPTKAISGFGFGFPCFEYISIACMMSLTVFPTFSASPGG